MTIAWSHLEQINPLGVAQLLKFKPELKHEHDLAMGIANRCPRPNCGGVLVRNYGEIQCQLCERVFNERGEEIKPMMGRVKDMRQGVGFRHG